MTNQAFEAGFTKLLKIFPNMNFDVRLFWEMLSDLDGQFFLMSVNEFIRNTKEVYPGSNVIAIIRERAIALQNEARQSDSLKLEAETEKERIERWQSEAVPMPEESRINLEKLGIRITPNPRRKE